MILKNWGIATIKSTETVDGQFVIHATVDAEDKDYKKKKVLTWIVVDPASNLEVTLVEFDHLITKKKVGEDEVVADIVNRNSRIAYTAIAEGSIRAAK